MKIMKLYFISVAVLLTGCGDKKEASPPPPPSSQKFEEKAKEYLKVRNEREGTGFNVEDEATRMRQEYSNLPDDKKREIYDKVSR